MEHGCEHKFQQEWDATDFADAQSNSKHDKKPAKRKWRCTKCLRVRRTED